MQSIVTCACVKGMVPSHHVTSTWPKDTAHFLHKSHHFGVLMSFPVLLKRPVFAATLRSLALLSAPHSSPQRLPIPTATAPRRNMADKCSEQLTDYANSKKVCVKLLVNPISWL